MSRSVLVTMARYRPYWDDRLHEACMDALAAALARPFDLAAFQTAVEHVAAVTQVIDRFEQR
jgi:hypothetical protein